MLLMMRSDRGYWQTLEDGWYSDARRALCTRIVILRSACLQISRQLLACIGLLADTEYSTVHIAPLWYMYQGATLTVNSIMPYLLHALGRVVADCSNHNTHRPILTLVHYIYLHHLDTHRPLLQQKVSNDAKDIYLINVSEIACKKD